MRDALRLGLNLAIEKYDIEQPMNYVQRTFYVDGSTSFLERQDSARYRQAKSMKKFEVEAARCKWLEAGAQLDACWRAPYNDLHGRSHRL